MLWSTSSNQRLGYGLMIQSSSSIDSTRVYSPPESRDGGMERFGWQQGWRASRSTRHFSSARQSNQSSSIIVWSFGRHSQFQPKIGFESQAMTDFNLTAINRRSTTRYLRRLFESANGCNFRWAGVPSVFEWERKSQHMLHHHQTSTCRPPKNRTRGFG